MRTQLDIFQKTDQIDISSICKKNNFNQNNSCDLFTDSIYRKKMGFWLGSKQLCFLWKVIRQNDTDLTSHRMQSKKGRRGLLHEANRSEGECFVR